MTEDEVISLGQYCENLLTQDNFTMLVKQFETQTIEHLLTTNADEKQKREDIYASISGVRDFLGLMRFFVDKKNQIIEEQDNKALSEDTDALPLEY
jgi:hypothetical protein